MLTLADKEAEARISAVTALGCFREPSVYDNMADLLLEDPEIEVGDVVFFKNFSGTEIEFDGREYLMMPYADILGRLVETDKI